MTNHDLATAWDTVHAANSTLAWHVGSPAFNEQRDEWSMYAFDPTERPKVGQRSREWTAVAPTEERVVIEMARCLREIGAGRVPK